MIESGSAAMTPVGRITASANKNQCRDQNEGAFGWLLLGLMFAAAKLVACPVFGSLVRSTG